MVMPPTNREYLKRDAVEVPNDPSQPKKHMLFALNTRGLGPLDPPSSPPNGDFHNLNHFRAVRDRDLNVNTTGETYNYTDHTGMRHIMELDDHGGRNHQLLEIHPKLYPIPRKVMGKDGLPVNTRNGKNKTVEVMAWNIVVKDMNHIASPALRPFRIPKHGVIGSTRVTRIRDGAKDICPTIEQARNLGNIVCKILNKYPHNLFKDVKERDQMKGGRLKLSASLDMDAPAIHEFLDKRMPDNFWFSGDWESNTLTKSGQACPRLKDYIIYNMPQLVYKKLSPTTLVRDLTATTGDSSLAAEFYGMNSSLHAWALKQGLGTLNQLPGLLNAVQNVLLAADKVNTGQVGLNSVKESYCHCNIEQLRRETYYVCMDCNDAYTCSTM
ncbi:hypothetical protein D6C77_07752 [Aureobasidium pullulans]|nr:hypothetical protein D6C77_07752 [Aureobasidium pullulans]